MGAIIKRDTNKATAADGSVRPIAYNFEDMSGRAEEYLDLVRREATLIVQEANAEAKKIRQQAEEAGREAAEKAIEKILDQKISQQMRTLRPALENVAHQMTEARDRWLVHWEQSTLHLATRIAERVIRRELKHAPEIPLALVREALELATGSAQITVRLNSQDYQHLRGETQAIIESLSGLGPTQVVPDDTVSAGGCLVKTEFGEIDQQIETQLARLNEELTHS